MRDPACIEFLQWALPRMRMRWAGFRRVRRQVCKRLARRVAELGLADLDAYRDLLADDNEEWSRLDSMCRVTISRFYRDRAVWDRIGDVLLPDLVRLARERRDDALRCWSVGCASGEEPYTLAMVWRWKIGSAEDPPPLRVVAGEAQRALLERAREGLYEASSLRDLPQALRGGFAAEGKRFRIDPVHREPVSFVLQDVRESLPDDVFHLVLCRNLVFTYCDESLQRELLARLTARLVPGGALVIGIRETLPAGQTELTDAGDRLGIHVRRPGT